MMSKPRYQAVKVMIVDDSRTIRTLVRRMLNDLGVTAVAEADDGTQALGRLRDFLADIVICDLDMSPVDGIDFIRTLRRSPNSPAPHAPVIILSSAATADRISAARRAGADAFLVKPTSPARLKSRIDWVLRNPREPAAPGPVPHFIANAMA